MLHKEACTQINVGSHALVIHPPRHTSRADLVRLYWTQHPRFRFFKTVPQDARFLDIGAGSGGLAHWKEWESPKRNDIRMFAIDQRPGESFHLYAGFSIRNLDHQSIDYEPSTFDVVFASHLLEHLKDENRFLTEVRRLMRVGGKLYIETPTPESLQIPKRSEFVEQGIQVSTMNFFDDHTHVRTFSLDQLVSLLRSNHVEPLTMGLIEFKSLEDDLLSYGFMHHDSELSTYALWSKFHFAQYIIGEAV